MFFLVLTSRVVYALMWFYVAPMLPLMLKDFRVSPGNAGLLPAVFIAGAALTQIPAGYMGARVGHNKAAGLGMAVFGSSAVLTGLADSWEKTLIFRALGGIGAGLFFSTAGAVLVILRPRDPATALGWYNATFNLGAFLGYYWGYIAGAVGWRPATALPGIFAVALGLALTQGPSVRSPTAFSWRAFRLGLASFPFWGSVYAANSLTATWAHLYRGVGEEVAGAISSTAMLSGLFAGIAGRLYRFKYTVLLAPLAASAVYLAIPHVPTYLIPLPVFIYGLSFSIYITAVYTTASRRAENPASALAVINVTNMALGMHLSYFFSWLMEISPTYPWLFLSTLVLTSALTTCRENAGGGGFRG
ncbi:MAG: MFS transporter [Pyrobaculum sp.]